MIPQWTPLSDTPPAPEREYPAIEVTIQCPVCDSGTTIWLPPSPYRTVLVDCMTSDCPASFNVPNDAAEIMKAHALRVEAARQMGGPVPEEPLISIEAPWGVEEGAGG